MAGETYWKCVYCGEVVRPTNMAEDVVGRWSCDHCGEYPSMWQKIEVVSVEDLAALRRLRERVEDHALASEYASITIPAAIMLPAYREALRREER